MTLIGDSELTKIFPELSVGEISTINEDITNLIQDYCNTTFRPVGYQEVYDSMKEIVLEHRPIISVDRVVDIEPLSTGEYFVYQTKIILQSPSRRRQSVQISYTAGYTEVPALVKAVAMELAEFKAFKLQEGTLRFHKSQKIEERSYETGDYSELQIMSQLSKYVQPVSKSLKTGSGPIRIGVM